MENYSNGRELAQNDLMNKVTEIHKFLFDLSGEYEEKLKKIIDSKRKSVESLSELEERYHNSKKDKENSSNLFSPNVKFDDIEEIGKEIKDMREMVEQLTKEQERTEDIIKKTKGAVELIELRRRQKKDTGLDMLRFQEQDRQRIARDLHDTTVQNLTGMVHKLELCTRLVDMDKVRAKLELAALSSAVKTVINEIREIIYNLKPMSLDDLGLSVTIERYAKQLMMNHDIKVSVKYNRIEEDILQAVKISLFRVIQEACNNVIKHAKASKIEINIVYQEEKIAVSIKDDGIGFDIDKQKDSMPDNKSGYGLSIMKERIQMLTGTMEISPNNPTGTNIVISVPLIKYGGDKNEQTD